MQTQDQSASTLSMANEQQEIALIKQGIEQAATFQKDPEKFSQLFTIEAVIVNVMGIRIIGRDEIYQFMKKAKESFLAAVSVQNEVVHITFIRPDVAVVSVIQHITIEKENQLKETSKGSMTVVLVKEEGKWLLAAGQNTLIQTPPNV